MSKIVQSFQRSIIVTFICAIVVVVAVSYYTISGIVNEQGRRQQESIIPFFSLISEQILKPLYISQTMANDQLLLDLIDSEQVAIDELERYLKRIETQLGLQTFIALEKPRFQINSDGRRFAIDEEVAWYFQIKDQPGDQFAMVGKTGDPHLYVDLRLRNNEGEFIGFIGIGIRLTDFIALFEQYKSHFGYDFVFTSQNGEIMLSSDNTLMSRVDPQTQGVETNINDLNWFNTYKNHILDGNEVIGSAVIAIDGEDVLVSNLRLKEYNWNLYVLSPLTTHQSEIQFLFIRNVVILFGVLLLVLSLIRVVMHYYNQALVRSSETDHLSGLPNRQYAAWAYEQICEDYEHIAIILTDIDFFKKINDTHGHNAGDEVIKLVSDKLSSGMRDQDVVARWGGEEFIIILPGADIFMARLIAERIRSAISAEPLLIDEKSLAVSVSLGVAQRLENQTLSELIENADKALYQAKNNGRNRVEVFPS